nr:hypothetical protein [uncultured Mucilaginibacter sp.]
MKKIIPFVALALIATSIYSCQKDHSVAPKGTMGALSKSKKDTTPPSFKVSRDTTPPAASTFTVQRDTTPPSK